MASITAHNLDDEVRARLRVRTVGNGRSMEEAVRLILQDAFGFKGVDLEFVIL
jgi:plasmid stability protein